MADIEQFLTKKAGPFPVWVWAAGAGGVASILFLYKKGGTPSSAAPTTGPYSPSPIIVTPGSMPDSTSSMNPPPPPQTTMITLQGSHGVVWLWPTPARSAGGIVATLPNGTTLPSAGPPVQGQSFTDGVTSNLWQPVKYAGATAYAWSPEAQASSGMGGASTVKLLSGGGKVGRFNSPHAHHQYLNVSGFGGGGHALHQVSKKTRIPLIRLQSLNPGHWRPGSGQHGSVVRIA